MTLRQINSPGVQISEIDKSGYTQSPTGTSTLVMGYSDKGVAGNPTNVVTTSDLQTNFGTPTNEAEAYFYNAATEVLNQGGVLWAVKLPYDNAFDKNFKYIGIKSQTTIPNFSGTSGTALKNTYNLTCTTDPIYCQLVCTMTVVPYLISTTQSMTNAEYDVVVAGNGFESASYDYMIVNEMKQTVKGLKETDTTDGVFVTMIDPLDAMAVQRTFSNCSADVMKVFCSVNGYTDPTAYYKLPTDTFAGSSYSEDMASIFPQIQYTDFGAKVDTSLFKHVTVIVAQSKADPNAEGKIVINMLETFTGSLNPLAKNKDNGTTDYVGDYINNGSKYIKFYNRIDSAGCSLATVLTATNIVQTYTANEAIQTLTFSQADGVKTINGANTINDVNSAFEKLADIDDKDIDVVVDAGLTTIAHYNGTSKLFDPANDKGVAQITNPTNVERWRAMASTLINFAQNIRKDCIAVIDVPRNFALETTVKKLRKTSPEKNFSNTLAPQIKYLTGLNSSYAAMYSDWMKAYDSYRGVGMWLPPSIKATGIFLRTDRIANYWEAPAGLNRGVIDGISDIAFNPIEKESSQLYTKGINFCKWYNGEGFILEGQRTTQVKPSAFDRINVRRMFLRLERQVYKMARYYVMELNTGLTRRKFGKAVEDILEPVKLAGGIFDYQVVCDDSINTPDVIDNNELRCVVKIKPTKVIEFILVDFIALSTKGSFSEV